MFIQLQVHSQVYCTGDTPFFTVDLTGNPSGTWISPAVQRDGSCCGAGSNQVNCIEMMITLDPGAIGINFSVFSGANPGGALYYQVNCQGIPISTGTGVICLNGVGPHYISYCKVGNNTNEYAITSIPGPIASSDITTAIGCAEGMSITGMTPATVSWNSISPGTPGQYNNYLSSTTGTPTGTSGVPFNGFSQVNVTPGVGAPSTIQYAVCGNVSSPCLTSTYCDTITVTVVPTLDVNITPAAPYLCYGQTSVALTANTTGGLAPYTYLWSNGQTTSSINVTTGGTYSVSVSDATGCPVATDQVTVVQFTQPITANAGPDLTVCSATSANLAVNGSVTGVTTGIWSGGAGTYSTNNTDLTLNYTLSAAEIAAGSVTLTLTTTNNGTCPPSADQVLITVSEMTTSVISVQNPSCFGGANGSAIIGATGGVLPYTYSLNGGTAQASNSFSNLPAGNYSVLVSDNAGCSGMVNFTVTQPPQLTFTSTPVNVTCFGLCNGQITVTPAGGTPSYTYSANNGTTFGPSNTLMNLCAGTIGVVVQDANGCLTNTNVVITQPAQLTATYTPTNPTCAGGSNGQIAVTPAGGTPAYQYSVDAGALQAGSTLTGLMAGNHTVLVQDAQGCQITAVQNLVNPPTFQIDLVSMSPSNCGFNNGAIEVVADGINTPFTYTIDGGTPQPTGVFSNLLAGAYSFVATDALGCQVQYFYGVNDIEMSGSLIAQGNVTCFGGNDGWVQTINTSGAPPITFELDNSAPSQTMGDFTGLDAGSHIVTIYDGGFCVFTIPFVITQPDEILFSTAVSNVTCNAGSNGSVTVTSTTGGTGAYQYSLDGITFQSGTTFTGLTAGTYDLYVTDANNCIASGTFTITQPTPVAILSNTVNLTCFGNNSGTILLDGTGGTPGYQYSINNGSTYQTSQIFFGLSAGTYNIVVQDIAGCTASTSLVLTQPTPLTSSYTPQAVSCFGVCDGEIMVFPSGGTSPYTFSVDNGVTILADPLITGLCAGTYSLQVIDDNGCGILSNTIINTPSVVTASNVVVPSTCDLPNGTITTTAGGGSPGYTYSIDNTNFSTNNVFTGLAAAGYTIYIQDANGCPITASAVVNSQPSPTITGITSGIVSCNGVCDGSITVTTTGGTGTIQYSNGGPYQLSNVFNNLCAGSYNLSITDDNGCVTNNGAPFVITEPAPLTFTTEDINLTCFDNGTGVINFEAQGGTTPYQYSITGGAAQSTNSLFVLLDAGTYNLEVEDDHGCTVIGQTTLTQPPLLEIVNLQATDAVCFDACNGTAEVTAQGGTISGNYTYNWYTVPSSPNASQITDLCIGDYTSVVLDANGCYDTINFTISQPAPMVIDSLTASNPLCTDQCNGLITLWSSTASTYSFDGGNTFVNNNSMNTLCEGVYNVIVQSPEGCTASIDSVILTDPPLLTVVAGPDSVLCPGTPGTLNAQAYGGTAPYTYYWDSQEQESTIVVVPQTTTSYDVIVQDANGCLSPTDNTQFSIHQVLTVTATADTTICQNTPINLSVTVSGGVPAYYYSWSTNGLEFAQTAQTTVSPSVPTTYIVVTSDMCTFVTDTVNVNTYMVPDLTFGVLADEGCAPMDVTLFPTIDPNLIGGNCTWTFSNGTVINGCDTITSIFTVPDCYSVTFTALSPNGCVMTGSANDVFCVIESPQASFTFNPTSPTYLNPDVQFFNTSSFADNYLWNFTTYPSSTEENPNITLNQSEIGDTIWACLTASNYLGCADQVCHPIVLEDEFTVYVPNTFTPDGDVNNQVFYPVFPPNYPIEKYQLLIFDRWGEVIFETTDHHEGWNGRYSSEDSQDGVYTWKIIVKDGNTNKTHELLGHVSLLR
jgi:gliding motility-associated-like protein